LTGIKIEVYETKNQQTIVFAGFGGSGGIKIGVFFVNQGAFSKITPPCRSIAKSSFFAHFYSWLIF